MKFDSKKIVNATKKIEKLQAEIKSLEKQKYKKQIELNQAIEDLKKQFDLQENK